MESHIKRNRAIAVVGGEQARHFLVQVSEREALDGNLCRCTGYDGIVTSILAAAETLRGH